MKKPFTISRFLLFIVTIVVCAAGYAANYFVPGTVWEYKETNMGRIYPCTVTLVDAVDADGAPCYKVVKEYIETELSGTHNYLEPKPISNQLVKIDGEKVYILFTREDESQWQLVYDFSLQPGEGCLIKETERFWWNYGSGPEFQPQKEVYFKFIGMTKIKHYDVEVMEMKVFWSEEESGDDSNAIRTHYWIPGVGSNYTFDADYLYLDPDQYLQSSFGSTLMKVTDAEGDVVVEYKSDKAANYFVPGTVWEYEESKNGQMYSTSVELVDAVDPDGAPCYQKVRKTVETDKSGNPVSDEAATENGWLVKVDGEKVYLCSPEASEAQWQLVYDFSARRDEVCLIKETQLVSGETPKEVYFKFIEMCKINGYDPNVMEMKVYRSKKDSDRYINAISTIYWIPGIGSTRRFDGCYRFPYPDEEPVEDQYISILKKVTDAEGNVIVELRGQSGIATVEAENPGAPAAYYNLQGMRVSNPSNGVFIRVEGGKTTKVLLK